MNQNNLKLLFDLKNENKALKNKVHIYSMESKALEKRLEASEKRCEQLEKSIDEKINNVVALTITKVSNEFNKIIKEKDDKIDKLTKEVSRLKSQINKDSSNSSKPSSTNGFKDIIQNNREETDKKPGGQPGHKGCKLELPSDLDVLIKSGKIEHKVIEHKKDNVIYSDEYITKYVLDVEIKTILTEHRFYKKIDPSTNEIINPIIPDELKNEVSYGLNIKSLSTILSNEGIIANKRLSSFFSSITNEIINISTATVISFNKLLASKLDETGQIIVIENNLLNGEVLNTDDTVIKTTDIPEEAKREREDRKVFRGCLRNYSDNLNTLYTYNPKKDETGIIADNILPRYHGIVAHDHEAKYYIYGDEHATCHPHVNREFKSVFENLKIDFATDLISFFNDLNKEKKKLVKAGINHKSETELKIIDDKYDAIIQKGWSQLKPLEKQYYYGDTVTLLMRMEDYKENYLLFIKDFKAPYTNNLSERDLRPTKIKVKVSGAFRSYDGGKIYAKNRSFISTIKKRKMNIFESIKSTLNDDPVLR